jgi:CheY-like chemotaxis protein
VSGATSVANRRALVVDDEPAIRHCIGSLLESQGFEVYTAASPSEALTISRNRPEHIDLLLTDLQMNEGLNGIELADLVLQDRAGIAVLVMSGTDDAEGLASAKGFAFLPKPLLPATLFERIREALTDRIPAQSDKNANEPKKRIG